MKLLGGVKQNTKVSKWLGGLKDIFAMSSIYLSGVNFLLIAMTAYNTTIKPMLGQPGASLVYLPWMRVQWFIALLALFMLAMMLFEYKVVYPSYYKFKNEQEYNHGNLLRQDLAGIKTTLDNNGHVDPELIARIDRRLANIESQLGIDKEAKL